MVERKLTASQYARGEKAFDLLLVEDPGARRRGVEELMGEEYAGKFLSLMDDPKLREIFCPVAAEKDREYQRLLLDLLLLDEEESKAMRNFLLLPGDWQKGFVKYWNEQKEALPGEVRGAQNT